jgi:regulator of Ty1 transposition protein 103
MSVYSEDVLVEKLSKLTDTQQSIQMLSHWIMYHRKRYKQSVELWQRELQRAPPSRQLLFLYVANDVMQSSRKRGPEFIKEFGRVIPDAVRLVYSAASSPNDELAKKVTRLLSIWDERKVFPSSFIKQIQSTLKTANDIGAENSVTGDNGENDSANDAVERSHIDHTLERNLRTEKNTSSRAPAASSKTPSDLLIETLTRVETDSTKLTTLRERAEHVLSTEMRSGEILDTIHSSKEWSAVKSQLDEALHLMEEYQSRLNSNLEARGRLITQLNEAIVQQEQAILATSEQLQTCQHTLELLRRLQTRLQEETPVSNLSRNEDNVATVSSVHKRPLASGDGSISPSDTKRLKSEPSTALSMSTTILDPNFSKESKDPTTAQGTTLSKSASLPPLKSPQLSADVKPDIPEATMDDEDAVREEQEAVTNHQHFSLPPSSSCQTTLVSTTVSSSSTSQTVPQPNIISSSTRSSSNEDYNPDVYIDEFYNDEEHVENGPEETRANGGEGSGRFIHPSISPPPPIANSQPLTHTSSFLPLVPSAEQTATSSVVSPPLAGGSVQALNPALAQLLLNPNILSLLANQNLGLVQQTLQSLTSQPSVVATPLSAVTPSPSAPSPSFLPSTSITPNINSQNNLISPLSSSFNPNEQNQQVPPFVP